MKTAHSPIMSLVRNANGTAATGTATTSRDTATGTATAMYAATTKPLKEVLDAWAGRKTPFRLIPSR